MASYRCCHSVVPLGWKQAPLNHFVQIEDCDGCRADDVALYFAIQAGKLQAYKDRVASLTRHCEYYFGCVNFRKVVSDGVTAGT